MKLLYQCMTKATTAKGDQMKYGYNWLFARRSRLKVFEDHLECGDWKIKNEEIKEATLYSIRSILFFPGFVLMIKTEEKTYHFGLNGGKYWKGELPFDVKREKGKLGYDKISIIIRIMIIGYLVYLVWESFVKK